MTTTTDRKTLSQTDKRWIAFAVVAVLILGLSLYLIDRMGREDGRGVADKSYYTGPQYNKRGDYVVDGKIVEKNALHLNSKGNRRGAAFGAESGR